MLQRIKNNLFIIVIAIVGIAITLDPAVLVLVLQTVGIVAAILFISSIFLDDREGKGIFPSYDEDGLIKKAQEDPLASAILVFTKNMFLLSIIYLAFNFFKP